MSKIKRFVRPVFAVVAAGFVIFVVKDMAMRFSGLHVQLAWRWVILSLVPACLAVVCQYQAWWDLVFLWTGRKMERAGSLRVYVDGQIARYTPGKVGLPAVRVAGSKALGVSPQIMISTLLAEVLAWSACGTILGGLLIFIEADDSGGSQLLSRVFGGLGVSAAVGLLLLALVPASFWPAKLVTLIGATARGTLMPGQVIAWQALHFTASAMSGLLLVLALGGSFSEGVYLGAVLCVAIVAGFLALLAPAGVGVREAVLALFAEPVLGTNQAVALGLLARAVSLSSELLLMVAARSWARRRDSVSIKSELS